MRPAPPPKGMKRKMRILAAAYAALSAILLHASPALAADVRFPELTGPVVDLVDEIPQDQEQSLKQRLLDFQKRTGHQFVVVTVPDLQGESPEDFGYKLGRHWGIGRAGADDGMILLHAVKERKVRLEVGRGLEPVVTDALSSEVVDGTVIPLFKEKQFAQGIEAGADKAMAFASITPEQKAIDDRRIAERNAAALQAAKNGVMNFLGILLGLTSIAGAAFGAWWLARIPARRRQREAEEARRQEAAEQARLREEEDRRERAAARERQRIAQAEETRRIEAARRAEEERRAEMLRNETPAQRRRREAEEAAAAAAAEAQRQAAAAARRERLRREEAESRAREQERLERQKEERKRSSSSDTTVWPTAPASPPSTTDTWGGGSSDTSYGGGGGDFGGGGDTGTY